MKDMEFKNFIPTQNTVIGHRFTQVKPIAPGCLGALFKAFDRKLKDHVHLKIGHIGYMKQSAEELKNLGLVQGREEFVKLVTGDIATRSKHGLHNVIAHEEVGESVAEIIKRMDSPIQFENVKIMLRNVISGLEFLHRSGIILGGLSSKNIRLQELSGGRHRDPRDFSERQPFINALISDMGYSRKGPASGVVIQIRAYRAPEVIEKKTFDTPVDIWSAGCLTYEMFTSKKLFNPEDADLEERNRNHLRMMEDLCGNKNQGRALKPAQRKYENALKGKILATGFEEDDAEDMSGFINCMLLMEPERRFTAKMIAAHDFIEIRNPTLGYLKAADEEKKEKDEPMPAQKVKAPKVRKRAATQGSIKLQLKKRADHA